MQLHKLAHVQQIVRHPGGKDIPGCDLPKWGFKDSFPVG
jgi:hypothetical protein